MRGAVVTLAGEAPSLFTRAQAIDIARRTGGVESVVNDVIIPAAESDQAIAEGTVKGASGVSTSHDLGPCRRCRRQRGGDS